MDVMVELGVPLRACKHDPGASGLVRMETYGPISDGVIGSDGGGGRLINVGADMLTEVLR